MRSDFILTGKIFFGNIPIEASLAIRNGKIIAIGKNLSNISSQNRIEIDNSKMILPGMVDIHVHMRDLELSYKEDWFTGTLSAAAGGVTFVVDMPNTKPKTNSIEVLKKKISIASSKAIVDFGLYFGVPTSLKVIEEAIKIGVLGLKIYPEDYDNSSLLDFIRIFTKNGKITIIHPELQEYFSDIPPHYKARLPRAEYNAVKRFIKIALLHSLRIHFTHVSTFMSLINIIRGKASGANVTFDVTPHHIFLNKSLEDKIGYLSKVNPPLRSKEDQVKMFNSFKNMLVDAYVTDHAPHAIWEKENKNYVDVPSGFPGLEIALPLLLDKIFSGILPYRVLNLYSKKPAELLNLNKGAFVVGYDADITIVDYKKEWIVKGEDFKSKARYTPFEGIKIRGKIHETYIRGVKVYEDNEVLVKPGFGKFRSG